LFRHGIFPALRVSSSASPSSRISIAIVVLLREPFGRPLGLPLVPGSNGRPRGVSPMLCAAGDGVSTSSMVISFCWCGYGHLLHANHLLATIDHAFVS
jgi:hypothetical protein